MRLGTIVWESSMNKENELTKFDSIWFASYEVTKFWEEEEEEENNNK